MTRLLIIIQLGILFICSIPCHSQLPDKELFNRLVASTKYFEGWHTQRTTPGHVGYGHKIQRGEYFPNALTRRQADSLLRSDLMRHYRLYTRYGKDALLLAALSYQIGPAKLLGQGKYSKSTLLTRLERGDRDILPLYLSFCKWNGRPYLPSAKDDGWSSICYSLHRLFDTHYYISRVPRFAVCRKSRYIAIISIGLV